MQLDSSFDRKMKYFLSYDNSPNLSNDDLPCLPITVRPFKSEHAYAPSHEEMDIVVKPWTLFVDVSRASFWVLNQMNLEPTFYANAAFVSMTWVGADDAVFKSLAATRHIQDIRVECLCLDREQWCIWLTKLAPQCVQNLPLSIDS